MSDLQLKPEFESLPADGAPRGPAAAEPSAAFTEPSLAATRGLRRRLGARRLRLSSDDGFHLFRVY